MFYVVLFSILAVLLVVAAVTVFSRNRTELHAESRQEGISASARRQRKAKRTQSRHDRRRRH